MSILIFSNLFFFIQASNPRLSGTSQPPGLTSHIGNEQVDVGQAIPPPVPVVGKLTVKGKFDFTSVSIFFMYIVMSEAMFMERFWELIGHHVNH